MHKLYAYEFRRTRSPHPDDLCGTFNFLYTQEKHEKITEEYEEHYTLLGVIQVDSYKAEDDWVITFTSGGQTYHDWDLFGQKYYLFPLEIARALLGITIYDLLNRIQLGTVMAGSINEGWPLRGPDLLALSLELSHQKKEHTHE